MSFFDTEEDHADMLAKVADEGGRAALQVTPTSLNRDICSGDGRPPGSARGSRLKATAQFGAKKASISLTITKSSRPNGNHHHTELKQ